MDSSGIKAGTLTTSFPRTNLKSQMSFSNPAQMCLLEALINPKLILNGIQLTNAKWFYDFGILTHINLFP